MTNGGLPSAGINTIESVFREPLCERRRPPKLTEGYFGEKEIPHHFDFWTAPYRLNLSDYAIELVRALYPIQKTQNNLVPTWITGVSFDKIDLIFK